MAPCGGANQGSFQEGTALGQGAHADSGGDNPMELRQLSGEGLQEGRAMGVGTEEEPSGGSGGICGGGGGDELSGLQHVTAQMRSAAIGDSAQTPPPKTCAIVTYIHL